MGLGNLLMRSVGVTVGAQIGARIAHRIRPRPYPAPLRDLLDHPARMRYRDPVTTLGPFGLGPGQTVLDLGCGTGTFTVEMARQVGREGQVHAVDIQASMIDAARARIDDTGLAQRVHFHHCGAYRLPLERDSVDVAVLIAALTEMPQPLFALEELRRVLKPGWSSGHQRRDAPQRICAAANRPALAAGGGLPLRRTAGHSLLLQPALF